VDSRVAKDGLITRRRRVCEDCDRRYTTYERIEIELPYIIKKDGRREAFDRAKITSGLKRACEKRPISMEQIDHVASDVERALAERGEKEVASREIGATVMLKLKDLDEVAYVRFASVYRAFRDVSEFMEELEQLIQRRRKRVRRGPKRHPQRPSSARR